MEPISAPALTPGRSRWTSRTFSVWRILARMLWFALVLLTLFQIIVSFPGRYAQFTSVCASCLLRSDNIEELRTLGLSPQGFAIYLLVLAALFTLIYWLVGATIMWRKVDDPLAVLVAFALLFFGGFASWGPPDPLASALPFGYALAHVLTATGRTLLLLMFFLFPDGHFAPRWARAPALLGVAVVAAFSLVPLEILPAWLTAIGIVLSAAAFICAVLCQVYRYSKCSSTVQREQTKWIVFGIGVAIGAQILELAALYVIGPRIWLEMLVNLIVSLAFLLVPITIGIAILRHQLFNIDTLINRTLVYGSLSVGIVALYALVVGAGSALFQSGAGPVLSLLLTGTIAVAFQPIRAWLQRGVNRLLYGRRDEPYTVLTELGQRLASASAPQDVLPAVVETVAQALKVPYAAIAVGEHRDLVIAAETGVPNSEVLRMPLIQSTAVLGELRVAPRAKGERFSAADVRLLEGVAREASSAVYALQLTSELRQSHMRLITLREEERRRLRRDLHDGVGSALTGIAFKLGATQNLLDRDVAAGAVLLGELKAETQAVIADLRRLVYDLRPPSLDELGLVSALREEIARLPTQELHVEFQAPEAALELPAAVEIAAYRIALEALANVIRHAQAGSCLIRLTPSAEMLTLEVLDDGIGLPADFRPGVGVSAMRERAAELGGSCLITIRPTGGVQALVQLPLLEGKQ
jgi:signal transduction histidine kinase